MCSVSVCAWSACCFHTLAVCLFSQSATSQHDCHVSHLCCKVYYFEIRNTRHASHIILNHSLYNLNQLNHLMCSKFAWRQGQKKPQKSQRSQEWRPLCLTFVKFICFVCAWLLHDLIKERHPSPLLRRVVSCDFRQSQSLRTWVPSKNQATMRCFHFIIEREHV